MDAPYSRILLGKIVSNAWCDQCHLRKQISLSDFQVIPGRVALEYAALNMHAPIGYKPSVFPEAIHIKPFGCGDPHLAVLSCP